MFDVACGVIVGGAGLSLLAWAFRLNTTDEGYAGPVPVAVGLIDVVVGIVLVCHP